MSSPASFEHVFLMQFYFSTKFQITSETQFQVETALTTPHPHPVATDKGLFDQHLFFRQSRMQQIRFRKQKASQRLQQT